MQEMIVKAVDANFSKQDKDLDIISKRAQETLHHVTKAIPPDDSNKRVGQIQKIQGELTAARKGNA